MNEKIKLIIESLKEKYGTCDPFSIAEYLDIEVLYVPFGSNPEGQYVKLLGDPTVLINDKLESETSKYFVLSHELFHYIEHEDLAGYYVLNSITRGKLESEANIFARELLLNYYIEETGSYPATINEVATSYGIPERITNDYI